MTPLLTMGEALSRNAWLYPDKCGARDLARSMTFQRVEPARRAGSPTRCSASVSAKATALPCSPTIASSGWRSTRRPRRRDWSRCRSTSACARTEIRYILEHCAARARSSCSTICMREHRQHPRRAGDPDRGTSSISASATRPPGLPRYEALIAAAADADPPSRWRAEDTWVLIYTSGTTGKPKGAMRSHGSHALLELRHPARHGLRPRRHAACSSCRCAMRTRSTSPPRSRTPGATCCVYDAKSFEPGARCCGRWRETRATFTSLVPTHYVMMLGLPDSAKARYDVGSVTQAADLVGAGAQGHQARDHGVLPELAAVRALRLDRAGLGHPAATAKSS